MEVALPSLPLAPFSGDPALAREKFRVLASRLLGDNDDPDVLRQAACDLYAFFDDIGGRPGDVTGAAAFTWQQESRLPTGNAINPYSAATCLLDFARTRAFACGVRNAIEAARNHFPDERIDLLYAGTGPFAPLALLQTPFFTSDEVSFTLIDIHEGALACQAQIISVLGLEEYIGETVQADAAAWAPPDGKKYHVAVAEVMQRALITEPQVGVTMAIARHLHPDGLLVPERIELTLCLLSPAAERDLALAGVNRIPEYFQLSGDTYPDATVPQLADDLANCEDRIVVSQPFAVTRSVSEDYDISETGQIRFPPVRLPDVLPPGLALRILTRITTSGDIVLGDYDSGLTLPEKLVDEPQIAPGALYELCYETQGRPGLRLRPAADKT